MCYFIKRTQKYTKLFFYHYLDKQFKDQNEYEGLKEYILEWWNKDKKLARKQINDGVAIFSHIYDEWKASSSK